MLKWEISYERQEGYINIILIKKGQFISNKKHIKTLTNLNYIHRLLNITWKDLLDYNFARAQNIADKLNKEEQEKEQAIDIALEEIRQELGVERIKY